MRSNWKRRLKAIDRRGFLAAAGLTAACSTANKPAAEEELPSQLGAQVSAYGERSKYETAKRRILATHGLAPAAGGSLKPAARAAPRVAVRRQALKKETPPRGGAPVRT